MSTYHFICLSIDRDAYRRLLSNIRLRGRPTIPRSSPSIDAVSCDLDKLFGSYRPPHHGRHQSAQVLSIRIRFEFAGQKCGSIRLSRFRRGLQFFMNRASFQIYRFLIADYNLRRFFNLSTYCGAVTFVTFVFVVIIAVCSITVSLIQSNFIHFKIIE